MDSGKYNEAISAFEELDGYKDSSDRIKTCENILINDYEEKHNLSEYIEVTIEQLWNDYSLYDGKKIKIIGYVGFIKYEESNSEDYYDSFLVKEKDLAEDVDKSSRIKSYDYWNDTLKFKHQYVGFRIMFNNYLQQVSSGVPQANNGDKIVLYGTFTYNASFVNDVDRSTYLRDPHGYDILVQNFLPL